MKTLIHPQPPLPRVVLAREGGAAVPADLRPLVEAAPAAPVALAAELLRRYCGHLGTDRMPGMVATQCSLDAAMVAALLDEIDRGAAAPPVLLAGKGSCGAITAWRRSWRRCAPGLRVLAVGFGEPADARDDERFDIGWATPAVAHEGPCRAFR